jgi:predicted nucleotidyltransferase
LFERILTRLAKELADRSIPYMVIGGQAVLLYGEPRLTKDIDVTLGLGVDGFQTIRKVAKALAFAMMVENPEDFVRRTMVLPVLDEESGIRIDFIFSFSEYEKQAIERAVSVPMKGASVCFASLEDVLIHKIVAGRPRDIEDVTSILLKNPDYDRAYIDKWLREFDASLGEACTDTFQAIVMELERN